MICKLGPSRILYADPRWLPETHGTPGKRVTPPKRAVILKSAVTEQYCSALSALGAQQGQGLADLAVPQLSRGPREGSSGALSVSGSIPPCQACEQDLLCSLRKWQFCRRSRFVKQTPGVFFLFLLFPLLGSFFYSLLPPHPTLSLGPFQEQPRCHSLPPKAQRASFTNPLAVQDTKKLN